MREEKTPHNLLYKRHPAVKTVGRLLEKVLLYNKMHCKKLLLDKLQRLGYYFICNEAHLDAKNDNHETPIYHAKRRQRFFCRRFALEFSYYCGDYKK